MAISKIPVLCRKPNAFKTKRSSMEMNSEVMYLQAKIKMLEKENEILKEERDSAVEVAQHLKSELLVTEETQKNEMVKHRLEISKIRKNRNRSFNFARKIQNFTECKLDRTRKAQEMEIAKIENTAAETVKATVEKYEEIAKENHKEIRFWKDKFQQLDRYVEEHNDEVNKEWPVLSDEDTATAISHIFSKQDQVESARIHTADDDERLVIYFRSNFSMVAILDLCKDGIREFKNGQIRRVPLESNSLAANKRSSS